MRSALKMSAISSRAKSPRRFTQGPRLVETVTSGEAVTMRRAKSLSLLAISCMIRPKLAWVEAVGCPACQQTGYRGRVGIYELVPVGEDMQQAVVAGATHPQLRAMARERGYRFLREDGLLKAWQGVTSIDEVLRVTAV